VTRRAYRSHVSRPGERNPSPLRAVIAVAGVVVVAGALLVVALTRPGDRGPATVALGDGTPPPTRAPVPPPAPGHEVYGFVPYWEMDAGIADHLAATDLTTLALFSVTNRRDGQLADGENGWRHIAGDTGRRLVAEAHERGTRVELVWTSFGADRNRRFFGDEAAQERWLEVLAAIVADGGFDGVNVDVEGLPVELVPAYGAFVGRLRDTLRSHDPAAQVSVATGASHLGAAMAAAASVAGADRIFLMGYDYRVAASAPGATSPIDRLDGEDKDLVWSLDLYAGLGVPVERTILGLPLYGVTWPVLGPEFGAAAVGRGDAWVPRRNLQVFEAPSFAPTFDPTESVEFYAAGARFWAIGYERGLPDYTELIASFRSGEDPAEGS
jgi:hypothetical protein